MSTLAPEDSIFRAPGGQWTEENYPISALLANKNDVPRTTSHADPPPLFFIARANFAYPGLKYKINLLHPSALLLVQPGSLDRRSKVEIAWLTVLRSSPRLA